MPETDYGTPSICLNELSVTKMGRASARTRVRFVSLRYKEVERPGHLRPEDEVSGSAHQSSRSVRQLPGRQNVTGLMAPDGDPVGSRSLRRANEADPAPAPLASSGDSGERLCVPPGLPAWLMT
ncbi:hypothetical protein A1Q1_01218 [Trichosporon asahii var. asahii CBS 2479]|uniref:Uncharacterized protein n=1 Tax=Trichosporon asahii var. asahii (strain ATCC 90039 / CBS 2479 / JCM 2466 / KCTC 7840 / NBRC 103889/ NCYC 2677 / UAMH 7654) TaxID=1186058 RepID=J6EY71_TRIAS|nr:hypothetical protein A1Q1_01218 [Trichosporon asahii var. asahii CBS 2479]EJT49589.1 hypothetical protein A1Q1_01218 [Trichosporon asahii var. asahii CBS 2479]